MTNEFDGWSFNPLLIRTALRSVVVFVCVCWSTITFATDYYVSPDGTATWPDCTMPDKPCKASNTSKDFLNAQAGDTVIFLNGLYSGLKAEYSNYMRTPAWYPENSGTAGNPIVFKALNPKGAILQGEGLNPADLSGVAATDPAFHIVPVIGCELDQHRSYAVWDGFVVKAVNHDGVPIMARASMYGCNHYTINNCEFDGANYLPPAIGVNWDSVRFEHSDYITITNCYIHDNESVGIKVFKSDYGVIRNNHLYNNKGSHIALKNGNINNFDIGYNYIQGGGHGISTTMSETLGQDLVAHVIHNNLFLDVNYPIHGNQPNPYVQANDIVIRNNTFVNINVRAGFYIKQTSATPGQEYSIYNNLFYMDNSAAFIRSQVASTQVVSQSLKYKEVDHNLIYNMSGSPEMGANCHGDVWYTTLSSWQSSSSLSTAIDVGCGLNQNPGCGSIVNQDPLFVNTSGTFREISDFALQGGSPAIRAGRDGIVDMGADIGLVGVKANTNVRPGKPRDFKWQGNSVD